MSPSEHLTCAFPTQLPISQQAEVLVVGGGPGGIGAAVAAARQGADVLLVEHYGFLGGMATAGEVNPFMPNHLNGDSLDTGIFQEWLDRIGHYDGRLGKTRVFDPQIARLAAEDLCRQAGVRLLYHHRPARVETHKRRIDGVVLHSKSGLSAARAQLYIDSTGDGDVAAMAGCGFDYGDADGHAQPLTMCFKLRLDPRDAGLEPGADMFRAIRGSWKDIMGSYLQGQKDGRISCPRENVLIFRSVEAEVIHFNTTRVIHQSSINGEQLSLAEIQARQQIRELLQIWREEVPIMQHARIHSIAPQIGIRESRRIRCRYMLSRQDFEQGRCFPDGIARITYGIDIHNPSGAGTEHAEVPPGAWYEVPLRSLLPDSIDNLLMACRSIGADHAVHSSLRVMPPVCSIGQAAGTAAAMSATRGIDPCQLDGEELRSQLIGQGCNLVPYDPERVIDIPDEATRKRQNDACARVGGFLSA
jgi:hypothetical protein